MLRCFIFLPLFFIYAYPGSAQPQFEEQNEVIALEAEHATTVAGWRIAEEKSGQALQDHAGRHQGKLTFDITVESPGKYYVYLLCLAPERDTGKNDCYVTLDGEPLYAANDSTLRPEGIRVHADTFVWSSLPKGPGAHTPNAIRDGKVYALIDQPGLHTLEIASRSQGFVLDKVILQKAASPPTATGHPETLSNPTEVAKRVGKWGQFETSLSYKSSDPFRETLRATFQSPSGESTEVYGFYDGDNTWHIRFMPDEVGLWQYEASFDGSNISHSSSFECLDSDIPGLISAYEENPIWFGYQEGEAELIRSFHIGDRFFANQSNSVTGEVWNDSMRTNFLDWVQSQGYNMLSIASFYLNRDEEKRGQGWNTPDLWNSEMQQPNPAEYRRAEAILDDLQKRKILIYPFAGLFGRGSDFPQDTTQQKQYVRYTLARFGAYWNHLFMLGGPEPRLPKRPYLTMEEIDWLAQQIEANDPYRHLLSVHNRTGDDEFIDYEWQDYGILQGPKTLDRTVLYRGLTDSHHPQKPLYVQETLWPGNTFGHPPYSLDDVRKHAYVIIMAAGAINFGDMTSSSSSGFSGTLDFAQKVQEKHDVVRKVWDFFEEITFYEMKPRQDLTSAGYCLANEGRRYLVYLESPQLVEVQVAPGEYQAIWINAQDTSQRYEAGTITNSREMEPPQEGDDWLLYLVSTQIES
jgi:hypothetical protein